MSKNVFLLVICCIVVFFGSINLPSANAQTQPRRIYIANDDHTDYMWTANEATYKNAFISMLDYYVTQANQTAGNQVEYQGKFSADGNFWLWTYEKNKTPAQFDALMAKVKDGHINVPINALVSTYGGQPLEGTLRGMYYAGRLERRYNTRFLSALAMENQVLPFGLGTIYAGAGAKYSWHGICGCVSALSNFSRPMSIYNWKGLDGSNILMKWHTFSGSNEGMGGYAEARTPSSAVDQADSQLYSSNYPYGVIGAFGRGWDDLQTQTGEFITTAQSKTTSSRKVIVSNEIDFFQDFEQLYGASLSNQSLSFGSEWDHAIASLAEVSARVKRAVEKLRIAEGLATIVSLQNASFMNSRTTARDLAFEDLGLYWEHDFGSGGSVGTAGRTTFEKRLATEIESYVNTLQTDAVTALSGMIQKSGTNQRFFVYNPLSWVRSDYADVPYSGATPVHVMDITTNQEVPSQIVSVGGQQRVRVFAPNIPSVGYKVFEIQSGAGQTYPQAATVTGTTVIENQYYKLTLSSAGAVTSLLDKTRGNREFVRQVNTRFLNDLGGGSGTLSVENAGPVSVTLKATATSPLAHTTRITLIKDSKRIEIQNEITQNFTNTTSYGFGLNLDNPDIWHEEEGAVIHAKLSSAGGHYATKNARYDWIALNHFADMTSSSGNIGVTLSNADSSFMNLGNSNVTTFDTTTPYIAALVGGQIDSEISGQGGDTYFMNRYALQTHDTYDQVSAMKFALEHQNPFVTNIVNGGTNYPADTYSLLTISNPNVLLWSVKPAEEGISQGIISRIWNLAATPQSFSISLPSQTITSAKYTTNIETNLSDETVTNGSLTTNINQQQTKTYRLTSTPSSATSTPTPVIRKGDINGDGRVDFIDMQLVLSNTLGSLICLTFNCDINNDGRVNVIDSVYVLKEFGL